MLSDYATRQELIEHAEGCFEMLEHILESRGESTYQETFLIKSDGTFNQNQRLDGKCMYLCVDDPEELMAVVEIIEKNHPKYKFELENDAAVGWCRYIVTRST